MPVELDEYLFNMTSTYFHCHDFARLTICNCSHEITISILTVQAPRVALCANCDARLGLKPSDVRCEYVINSFSRCPCLPS